MPRKESKVVHKSNDPVPQDTSGLLGGITMKELRRVMSQAWDEVCNEYGLKKPENPREIRATEQRSPSLEQEARQPRLATEADVPTDTKTNKR